MSQQGRGTGLAPTKPSHFPGRITKRRKSSKPNMKVGFCEGETADEAEEGKEAEEGEDKEEEEGEGGEEEEKEKEKEGGR